MDYRPFLFTWFRSIANICHNIICCVKQVGKMCKAHSFWVLMKMWGLNFSAEVVPAEVGSPLSNARWQPLLQDKWPSFIYNAWLYGVAFPFNLHGVFICQSLLGLHDKVAGGLPKWLLSEDTRSCPYVRQSLFQMAPRQTRCWPKLSLSATLVAPLW